MLNNLNIEFFTAIAAVIAAITGVVTVFSDFYKNLIARNDHIILKFGTPQSNYENVDELLIQNVSDHTIRIYDYGFIRFNGTSTSIPDFYASINGVEGWCRTLKSEELLPGQSEISWIRFDKARSSSIGCWAITTKQKEPFIVIQHSVEKSKQKNIIKHIKKHYKKTGNCHCAAM